MNDYINYIDFSSIKLGDIAYEIGDYKSADDNYFKALKRLRNYQGDRMQPIMMASELVEKIEKIKSKIGRGKSILKFDVWKLTKSSFVKGNQCLKYLYLNKHKKQEKTPISKEKQKKFDQGHFFEEKVRKEQFPNGINVKDKVGHFAYFNSYTSFLINSEGGKTIYEATIIEEDVLVMCDILIKEENGKIDIYEIKFNTEVNDAIIADLAIQYTICKKRFNSNLNSFNVILRTENENWKIENLTTELDKQINNVLLKISEYKAVLTKEEPIMMIGEHCNKPYECEFIDYCTNKC